MGASIPSYLWLLFLLIFKLSCAYPQTNKPSQSTHNDLNSNPTFTLKENVKTASPSLLARFAKSLTTEDNLHHDGQLSRSRIPIATPNFQRVAIPFVICMWVLCTSLIKIALNSWPRLLSIVPESCCLILFGLLFGVIFYMTNTSVLSPLSSAIFFFCMLPPIILDSGFFMPNRTFFDNIGTITFFAVVGTIFNAVCIGVCLWACGLSGIYGFDISLLETLIFSCLISAVDPVAVLAVLEELHVDQVLYIIVFGESLLNDAVSVVLYNMVESYITIGAENIETADVFTGFASFTVVALCGIAIGVFWGFLAGLATKYSNRVHVIEPIFIFVASYAALINAEVFQMSGILSVFFCAITMKNYVAENMSPTSLTTVKRGLKMLSNCSESIIFVFLGVSTVTESHEWNTAFVLLTVLFCTVFRTLGVIILTGIANCFRLQKINSTEKLVMSYGGLRGAIAFALVLLVDPKRIPRQKLFVTSTLAVLYFTVFFQGITIKPLVKFLKVKRDEKREKTMNERLHEKMLDYTMAGVEDILGQFSSNKIRDKFKQWNYAYIRPCLIRENSYREPKILETFSKLMLQDAAEFARLKPRARTDSFASFLNEQATKDLTQSREAIVNIHFTPSTNDLSKFEAHHHSLAGAAGKPHRNKCAGESSKRKATVSTVVYKHHRFERRKPHKSHNRKNQRCQGHMNDAYEEEEGNTSTAHLHNDKDIEEELDTSGAAAEISLPWKTVAM